MIDITYFANKVKPAHASVAADLPVTFRGIVYPWHLDHMDHMNVQHYVGMFDQASWVLLAWLGLDGKYFMKNQRGMAALEQSISYKDELRAGEMFEIRSAILEVREKTIRLRHDMYKVDSNTLAASTSILAVHLDTNARKDLPLPVGLRERARVTISSEDANHQDAGCQPTGVSLRA